MRAFEKVGVEMSLRVLGYNLTRVTKMLGVAAFRETTCNTHIFQNTQDAHKAQSLSVPTNSRIHFRSNFGTAVGLFTIVDIWRSHNGTHRLGCSLNRPAR